MLGYALVLRNTTRKRRGGVRARGGGSGLGFRVKGLVSCEMCFSSQDVRRVGVVREEEEAV